VADAVEDEALSHDIARKIGVLKSGVDKE